MTIHSYGMESLQKNISAVARIYSGFTVMGITALGHHLREFDDENNLFLFEIGLHLELVSMPWLPASEHQQRGGSLPGSL